MSATTAGLVQLGALVLLLATVYVPFGNYLAVVYSDGRHWRVERAVYRVVRVDLMGMVSRTEAPTSSQRLWAFLPRGKPYSGAIRRQ